MHDVLKLVSSVQGLNGKLQDRVLKKGCHTYEEALYQACCQEYVILKSRRHKVK